MLLLKIKRFPLLILSRGFLLPQAAHRLRIRFFISLSFSEHIHSLADSFLLGKEKSTSNEKSLLALLTCHLLIFYRYGITACIPHVKNHTNDTLKPHRFIVYTILQMNLAQFPVFHLRSIKHPQPNRDSPA